MSETEALVGRIEPVEMLGSIEETAKKICMDNGWEAGEKDFCEDCGMFLLETERWHTTGNRCFDCCEEYHMSNRLTCQDHGKCPYKKCNANLVEGE